MKIAISHGFWQSSTIFFDMPNRDNFLNLVIKLTDKTCDYKKNGLCKFSCT